MNKRQLKELLKLALDALGRQASENVNQRQIIERLEARVKSQAMGIQEANESIAALEAEKAADGPTGSLSDGHHTFDELYDHRHMLFLNLVAYRGGWISRLNPDGTSRDGWFIAGVTLPTGDITYHAPMRLWDTSCMFLEERERAPKWDGHTSADVLMRLYHNIWTGEK